MRLLLSRAHYPVTVLGVGNRIGIWFQGCHIGCRGCVSQDTWDPDQDTATTVENVLAWCRSHRIEYVDGITISGGEPFDQPEALEALTTGLVEWRAESSLHPLDLLCFSGNPLGYLQRHYSDILDKLDVVVSEPYIDRLPSKLPLRGS